ncbi:DUF421 domain-containing protein [Clostridium botulinum]|uniref:DUF421 domain-containing protein n=1 Tax=Clostridium sp. ZBS20 TaxID=2949966 RepID=UPI0013F8A1FC|nr:DUF421 domain-containing protein [Clostridium sp. ZBS20]MBN1046189.1 DUF421 domain-containing protein [Clostridium botulinum]MBN1052212.1 DUF421 domain-containing protein [Clostridium botulinum]NFT07638.1 DUF421 domain-containing protein [Clostridium botulinum]
MGKVLLITIIKGVGLYVLAIFLTRKIGRKIISQMNFFDFIMGVSMGSIIANAIIDKQSASISATATLILFSILTIITEYLSIKSLRIRKLINSEPMTLVENGKMIEENMKKSNLTINELMMKLREKNAFNLADIEFAIMETDGQLSVLPKADKKPLTPYHMKIKVTSSGFERDIIIDGTIIDKNLKSAGLNKEWLKSELNKQNIKESSEVFYAGVDNTKKLYILKKSIKK